MSTVEPEAPKKTDWLAYYICGRGGAGYDTPHYVLFGQIPEDYEDEDLANAIIYTYETWAITAERYDLRWETNVVPPREVVEAKMAEAHEAIKRYENVISEYSKFINENYV